MKTRGTYGTIVGQQRDRVVNARAQERECDIEDSYLWARRVEMTSSNRRWLVDQSQFRASILSDVDDLDLFLDEREMMRMSQLMFRHRFMMTYKW